MGHFKQEVIMLLPIIDKLKIMNFASNLNKRFKRTSLKPFILILDTRGLCSIQEKIFPAIPTQTSIAIKYRLVSYTLFL